MILKIEPKHDEVVGLRFHADDARVRMSVQQGSGNEPCIGTEIEDCLDVLRLIMASKNLFFEDADVARMRPQPD